MSYSIASNCSCPKVLVNCISMSLASMSLLPEAAELMLTDNGPLGDAAPASSSFSSLSSLLVLLAVAPEPWLFPVPSHPSMTRLLLLFRLNGESSCLGSAKCPDRNGVAMNPKCLGSATFPLWNGYARCCKFRGSATLIGGNKSHLQQKCYCKQQGKPMKMPPLNDCHCHLLYMHHELKVNFKVHGQKGPHQGSIYCDSYWMTELLGNVLTIVPGSPLASWWHVKLRIRCYWHWQCYLARRSFLGSAMSIFENSSL